MVNVMTDGCAGVCACVSWHPMLLLGFRAPKDLLFCRTALLHYPILVLGSICSHYRVCVCEKRCVSLGKV